MADSKSRHRVESVGAELGQAALRPLSGGLAAPTAQRPPEAAEFTGSLDRSLPSQERESMTGLGEGPGPLVSRGVSGHLNLLPFTVSDPLRLSKETHSPSTPRINEGVRACNTYNEVSVALAKFNYGCICFLIFPRWFDFFLKTHTRIHTQNLNYKGTDCTVAFCRR